MEQGLKPHFDKNTKILIVGTFPSVQSREVCYYNNPKNIFWEIMADIYNNQNPLMDKKTRYACLKKNGVGLWDVIETCVFEKTSSLDSKIIKNTIVYNDFSVLQQECPHLECIVFSSKNAKKLFDKYLKTTAPEHIKDWLYKMTNRGENVLPSTSPAYARESKAEKIEKWRHFFARCAQK